MSHRNGQQSVNHLEVPVVTYPCIAEPHGKSGTVSWERLCRSLSTHVERTAKDGKLWSPVCLDPCYRKSENVVACGAFVADVDDYCDPDEFLKPFEAAAIAYLAYSTYSNHPERPKYRVVLPFARLISGAEYPAVWRAFAHLYGHIDPVCKDRARAYFTPAAPPAGEREGEPWVRRRGGQPLDPDVLIHLAPPPAVPDRRETVPFPTNGHRPDARIILERSLASTAGKARHYRGFHLAEQLRDNRYTESEAEPVVLALQQQIQDAGDHPYTEREALASLKAAYLRPARDPWPEKPFVVTSFSPTRLREARDQEYPGNGKEPSAEVPIHRTDLGNSMRLVRDYKDRLRHAYGQGWMAWSGRHWAPDRLEDVLNCAKETARSILAEASDCSDKEEAKKLAAWSFSSQSAGRIHAMLDLAKSDPAVRCDISEFDRDPFLFNCANGVLDLRTGILQPHCREGLHSLLSPAEYDPAARFDPWNEFLVEMTGGDADLEAFLQRAVGLSLSGDVSEEAIFFALGPTGTGKSTFLSAVGTALGTYAAVAQFDTFLMRITPGGPRSDIVRLRGKRFVASVETERGRKFASGLMKQLSGDDGVAVRSLHKEEIDYRPEFKLWLAANDAPEAPHDDDGFWRRMYRIPFVHAPRHPSKHLKARLRERDAGAAILAWAFAGFQEWQRQGLGHPEAVRAATAEYRNSMDPLDGFFPTYLKLDQEERATADQIKEAYWKFVHDNDIREPLSAKKLLKILADRGVRAVHTKNGRHWQGVGVVAGSLFGLG